MSKVPRHIINPFDDTYHTALEYIATHGVESEDRTGTGTLSVFGYQMRFDLSKGLPLLTTKKIHFKSVLHETLWFFKGNGNIKYLKDNGVTIWNEWRKPYTLERDLVFVEKREKPYEPYTSSVFSYNGLNTKSDSIERKLAESWVHMMKRCYDETSDNYRFYGGVNVSVCKRWHDVGNFIEDVKKLPHWYYKLNNWNEFELDKDYYGSNQYSPDTCVWLSSSENKKYTKAGNPIVVTKPDGSTQTYLSYSDVISNLGITRGSLYRLLHKGPPKIYKQKNKQFLGWDFEFSNTDDKLLRLELIKDEDLGPVYGVQWRSWRGADWKLHDQVQNVIDQIKNNPESRRMIVSGWNVSELDKMALPPCHLLHQFYVRNGKLSCQVYIRSNDMFLGNPYNIVNYSIITHMVASVCDLEVGELIVSIGDAHIYKNHLDYVYEQLKRDSYAPPKLILNKKDRIEDFTFEDFQLVDYQAHPNWKDVPVAV